MVATDNRRLIARPAALWGIFGFVLILSQAILRLAPLAYHAIASGQMTHLQWGLFAGSILFNGAMEGYVAFQLQVAPRVVARAIHLAAHPRRLHVALAPMFCMTLFHATRKRLLVSWCVYVGIICLIIIVRRLPQPWRGIVDAGVVVGLTWGVVAIVAAFVAVRRGGPVHGSPELPVTR